MPFQSGRYIGNIGSIRLRQSHTIQRKLEGREQIHADIPFNIGNIIAGSRFLRIQFDQFIFGHGVEADYLIVRRNCHVKISGLLFKTKLILRFNKSNRDVAAAEFMRQIFYIRFIAKHFLALENDGTYLIGSIQLFQEKIYIFLRHMGFISGTQYHIEPMRSCIFHSFRINAQFHLHKLIVHRIDFQRFHAVHIKGAYIIAAHKKRKIFFRFLEIGISFRIQHRLDINFGIRDSLGCGISECKFTASINAEVIMVYQLFRCFIIHSQRSNTAFPVQRKQLIR